MKIAQRFSAGLRVNKLNQSPRSGRQISAGNGRLQLLSSVSRTCNPSYADPSAEALGYSHTVRYRERSAIPFFWANWHLSLNVEVCNELVWIGGTVSNHNFEFAGLNHKAHLAIVRTELLGGE